MTKHIEVVIKQSVTEDQLAEVRAAAANLTGADRRIGLQVAASGSDARGLAERAALAGADTVVAAGGDGTVNAVVNGLAAADWAAALAVIPLGTANDFAAGLGLPESVDEALRVAVEGGLRTVDVAHVNGRYFINVSTGGFGAAATQEASRRVKRRLGALAYLLRGARKIVAFEQPSAVMRADDEVVHEGEFTFFAVGNARQTGGGTPLVPHADMDDGSLDIVIADDMTRIDFMKLVPELRAGSHLENPHIRYHRARTFEVESTEDLAVNADGEAVFGRRFQYGLVRGKLGLRI